MEIKVIPCKAGYPFATETCQLVMSYYCNLVFARLAAFYSPTKVRGMEYRQADLIDGYRALMSFITAGGFGNKEIIAAKPYVVNELSIGHLLNGLIEVRNEVYKYQNVVNPETCGFRYEVISDIITSLQFRAKNHFNMTLEELNANNGYSEEEVMEHLVILQNRLRYGVSRLREEFAIGVTLFKVDHVLVKNWIIEQTRDFLTKYVAASNTARIMFDYVPKFEVLVEIERKEEEKRIFRVILEGSDTYGGKIELTIR